MKKLLTGMLIFFALYSVSSALGTVKVSINYFGESSTNVSVSVVDYDGPTLQYAETTIGNLSSDASGVLSFKVGVDDQDWIDIDPANITGSWVLNIYLDGILYSQMRLDQLIMEQSDGLLNMDTGGNIVPDDGTQSFGSDTQRWGDIFVGPETVHIGESGDEATISFDLANDEMNIAINGTEEVNVSPTTTAFRSVTINNLAGSGTQNLQVDNNGTVNSVANSRSYTILPTMLNSSYFSGGVSFGASPTGHPRLDFADGQTSDARFTFPAPTDMNPTSYEITILYSGDEAGGQFDCSMASDGINVGSTVAVPGVGGGAFQVAGPSGVNILTSEVAGGGNFAGNEDLMIFTLRRRGGNAPDTNNGVMHVYGIIIKFTE